MEAWIDGFWETDYKNWLMPLWRLRSSTIYHAGNRSKFPLPLPYRHSPSEDWVKHSVRHLTSTQWIHRKPGALFLWLANPLAFGQCHLELLALPAPASAPSPWLISIVGHRPSDPTVCSVFVSQWPLPAGIPGFTSCIETRRKMFRTVYWKIINPVCSQKTIKRDFCWIKNVAYVTHVNNILRPETQAHHCLWFDHLQ